MASAAQVQANLANSQLSTGPRTAQGKARSSRNNLRHGLTLGILSLDPSEQAAFCEYEAKLHAEIRPEGILEQEALAQLLDGIWRIRKVRAIVDDLVASHDADPFVHPDTDAQLRQLTRYRAAAEMIVYRSIKTLRELQSLRLFREFHLTSEEHAILPPLVNPGQKIIVGGVLRSIADRRRFYKIHGVDQFACRFPAAQPGPAIYQFGPNRATGDPVGIILKSTAV